jgi:DNA-binding transcriptional MerR regulator
MKISELSEKTGISSYTLRFYEKKGLLDQYYIERNRNGYRSYRNEIILVLNIIKFAKQIGFTLKQIEVIFKSNIVEDKRKVLQILYEKEIQINKSIDEMNAMKILIQKKIQKIEIG